MCVTGHGLENLKVETLAKGCQVSETNQMLGVDSRTGLLNSLGKSLLQFPDVFGAEGRPGNLVGTDSFLQSKLGPRINIKYTRLPPRRRT